MKRIYKTIQVMMVSFGSGVCVANHGYVTVIGFLLSCVGAALIGLEAGW